MLLAPAIWLTGTAYVLVTVVATSATANRLAWGALGSTEPLRDRPVTSLAYEATHATFTYALFALGVVAVLAWQLASETIRTWREPQPRLRLSRAFVLPLSVACLIMLPGLLSIALFVITPISEPGFTWEQQLHPPKGDVSWGGWQWWIPAAAASLAWLFAPWRHRLVDAGLVALAATVVPVGRWLEDYFANEYLCYGSPEIFAPALRLGYPVWVVLPACLAWYRSRWKRRSQAVEEADTGSS